MTSTLTPAAKRYLAMILEGGRPALTYGPYVQLRDAGIIEGPQDSYSVVAQ